MADTDARTAESTRHTYGQVETALAGVFAIDSAGQQGWLRGRLQHIRRLGLVADRPGRGRVIDYTRDDVDKWLVAIELEHFGLDPSKVVDLIRRQWDAPTGRRRSVGEAFARGEASISDLVSEARASTKLGTDVLVTVQFGPMATAPVIGYLMAHGAASLAGWLGDQGDSMPRRASVFNLSARLRALDRALAEAVKPEVERSEAAQLLLDAGKLRRGEMTLKEFRGKHGGSGASN